MSKNVLLECLNRHENFLNECYNEDTYNNAPLVSINEMNAKSMIDRHTKNGYIVISPCRGGSDFNLDVNNPEEKNKWQKINNDRIKEMIKQIKASGYSYTPSYGGFIENLGTDDEENVYERSFIIYNRLKGGGVGDFKDLLKFGQDLAKQYNQDSFLAQAPNDKPKYVKANGDIDMEFSGDMEFNDLSQEYFTDLHKNTHKSGNLDGRTPTRFSFVESYVNPAPQCYGERVVRSKSGEIFVNEKMLVE